MTLQVGYLRDESSNFECLAILDDASGDTFELQRALKFDAQDAGLGQDTYCLVRGGRTHYGGVKSWNLTNGALTVALNGEAATALQLPDEIEFEIPGDSVKLLADHFQAITQMGSTLT